MNVDFETAQADLVAYGRRMLADGLVVGSAGNLSTRVADLIAITPSGVPYDALVADEVCALTLDGEVRHGGQPSSEWPLHRLVYDLPDAAAVVHTHSPWVVTVATSFAELPAIHYSIARLGGNSVPVASYHTYGSDELAGAVAGVLRDGHYACLLGNHGAVTYGRSLAEAYDRAVLLEWLARVYCQARLLGEPSVLSARQLDDVRAQTARRARERARA